MKNRTFRYLASVTLSAALIVTGPASVLAAESTAAATNAAADTAAGDTAAAESTAAAAADTAVDASKTPAGDNLSGDKAEQGTLAGYELEEVSTFAHEQNMQGHSGAFVVPDGDGFRLINPKGEKSEKVYYSCQDLKGGYYVLSDSNETGVDHMCLVTIDGEVLIDGGASIISWLASETGEDTGRYLKVVYSTGVTENEDDCFFYSTDRMIAFQMEEGDVMYSGYAKIYDTQKKQFVEGVEVNYGYKNAAREIGSHFTVQDKETQKYHLYDENGKELYTASNYSEVGPDYLIDYSSGSHAVIDENGKAHYSGKINVSSIDGDYGYIKEYTDDGYVVEDLDGKAVLPNKYKYIYGIKDGVMSYGLEDGTYGLVNLANGEHFASSTEMINEMGEGYYYNRVDGKYNVFDMNGELLTGLENSPSKMIIEQDGKVYVIGDKDFTLELHGSYANHLDFALITDHAYEEGGDALYELFTGKQLFDYNHRSVEMVSGYIYARSGDTWTVYRVKPIYN